MIAYSTVKKDIFAKKTNPNHHVLLQVRHLTQTIALAKPPHQQAAALLLSTKGLRLLSYRHDSNNHEKKKRVTVADSNTQRSQTFLSLVPQE